MNAALIKDELNRRSLLHTLVDTVLTRQFYWDSNRRVKRCKVHDKVAEIIGVPLNNELVSTIKEALTKCGVVSTCSRGTLYYKGLYER